MSKPTRAVLAISDYYATQWHADPPHLESAGASVQWCVLSSRHLVQQENPHLIDPALSLLANGQIEGCLFLSPETTAHFFQLISNRLEADRLAGILDGVRLVAANSETLAALERFISLADANLPHPQQPLDCDWKQWVRVLESDRLDNSRLIACTDSMPLPASLLASLEARGAELTLAPVAVWEACPAPTAKESCWSEHLQRWIAGHFDLIYIDSMHAADKLHKSCCELFSHSELEISLREQSTLVCINRRDACDWSGLRFRVDRTIRAWDATTAKQKILELLDEINR